RRDNEGPPRQLRPGVRSASRVSAASGAGTLCRAPKNHSSTSVVPGAIRLLNGEELFTTRAFCAMHSSPLHAFRAMNLFCRSFGEARVGLSFPMNLPSFFGLQTVPPHSCAGRKIATRY